MRILRLQQDLQNDFAFPSRPHPHRRSDTATARCMQWLNGASRHRCPLFLACCAPVTSALTLYHLVQLRICANRARRTENGTAGLITVNSQTNYLAFCEFPYMVVRSILGSEIGAKICTCYLPGRTL